MTVAVSCNLSEGVILGVDSAVTVPGPQGVLKVFEDANKLFQLGSKPIGIAVFGLGSFGNRSIGSYIREFELKRVDLITEDVPLTDVVEGLRSFFFDTYSENVIPAMESGVKKKWKNIPDRDKPSFGLVAGGFSPGEYLSEIWLVNLPSQNKSGMALQKRGQGEFGTNWFAVYDPIERYIKGIDPALFDALMKQIEKSKKISFSSDDIKEISEIIRKFEYSIIYNSMPFQVGIDHTRFLVEMVVNHYKYAIGATVVGGKTKMGIVTYDHDSFQILEN